MVNKTLQLDCPLVVLDLETTSVDTNVARIVQIAVVKLFPDPEEESVGQSVLINPCVSIPDNASKVHGIKDDYVKDAKTFKDIADTFSSFLHGADLAGYNVKYDLRILDKEFERVGSTFRTTGGEGWTPKVIDAYKGWQILESRTLSDAYQRWCGKDAKNAHDAMADVEMTIEVLAAQMPRFQNKGAKSIDEIHKLLWPGEIDRGGFFGRENEEIVFKFGKHKGEVAKNKRSYLSWMLSSDFPKDTLAIARKILNG